MVAAVSRLRSLTSLLRRTALLQAFLLSSLASSAASLSCSSAELRPASETAPTTRDPEAVGDDGTEPGSSGRADGGTQPPGPSAPEAELPMSSGVTIQVQPSDTGAALLSAIRGAKKSVHLTMYLLTDNDIVNALGELEAAGKDVKVILNKTFPPNGGDNQPKFTALKNKGVAVQWAPPGFQFTHAKTVVIDGEKAIIMTMNMTESSAKTNREYIATDTDPADVADLEKIFAADLANQALSLPSKLVISPSSGNTLRSARALVVAFVSSAKVSLDLEIQSLSDEAVVDAIVQAHAAKVDVRLVIDGDTVSTPAQDKALAKLKAAGLPVRSLKSPDMHAKVIVVDGARTFVGSQNMTPTALDQNREIGVLSDAAPEAVKVQKVIAADFAKGAAL